MKKMKKQNRNEKCNCGSGKKYKNCCEPSNKCSSNLNTKKNIIRYAIGEKFPDERYLTGNEIAVSMINQSFFDVFRSVDTPNNQEVYNWTKGKLDVFLYEESKIPFILFKFENGDQFDVNINIQVLADDYKTKWLDAITNYITLFLIDSRTGLIYGIRRIQILFADQIKDICKGQLILTVPDINGLVNNILSNVPAHAMIKNALCSQCFNNPLQCSIGNAI
jgi:hypothetical protein